MKLWAGAVAVLLAVQPARAQERATPYVDPALRLLVQPAARRAIESAPTLGGDAAAVVQPFAGRMALIRENALVEPRVAAFAQLRGQNGLSELRTLGVTIRSVANQLATVELPISAIDRLATITGVSAFEAAHNVSITHDSSMNAIRLNEVRREVGGVWTGATGRGVIVGVYDTGIDFLHEDFRDAAGNTRILALWDQTEGGPPPPPGFVNGHLCTRDAIQRVIDNPSDRSPCPQEDTNGHGSHTAGTAAGDGSAIGSGGTPFQYAGVAPNADLMIVKGGNGSFSEVSILEGLRWLEEQARALNRPMVVNLSLGGQTGAHDGSRLYEQEIDRLSRPGFMVVIAAGNDGSNGNVAGAPPVFIHGTGNALTGATRDFTFQIPNYAQIGPSCNEVIGFSLWYEPEDRLRITLIRPDGSNLSADPGQSAGQDNPLGYIVIHNAAGPNGITPNPQNGDMEVLAQTSDCGSSGLGPAAGTWTLRVATIGTGTGRPFHFWMNQNFLGGGARARHGAGFDNRFVVGSPGNARSAITVGAFATRMCWPTAAGQTCFTQREEIGDLAGFSSGGPTRDLRIKPEITAPGIFVVSVRSSDSNPSSNFILPDGVHRANAGTSMAAPHVTGAVALMLEVDARLTQEQTKAIFARTAARDEFTTRKYSTEPAAMPIDWWGYGKLDVTAALCGTGAPGGSTAFVRVNPVLDTMPQNATLKIDVCAMGGPVVFESSDPSIATVDASGLVHGLQLGRVLIIARVGTAADTTTVTVVAPSVIVASGSSVAPADLTTSAAGTLLPLLNLGLRVNGVEGVRIDTLTFVVSGEDPGARVVVVQDLNRNGALESSDRVVGTSARGANSNADTVAVATPGLTLAPHEDVPLVVGLQLSGAAPNKTAFSINFLASRTRTIGLRSLARDRVELLSTPIASSVATTTVLVTDEVFSLSENPVRSNRVVFNFSQRPTVAGIYTLSGRRVRDLAAIIDHAGQVIWNLENEDGTRVAPGIYLIVFNVAGQLRREKLFVLTPR